MSEIVTNVPPCVALAAMLKASDDATFCNCSLPLAEDNTARVVKNQITPSVCFILFWCVTFACMRVFEYRKQQQRAE